jgi:hypothetical protein
MSESVYPAAGERCADCTEPTGAEPVPVLGPFIGVAAAVLCILVGGFLLLAPYAFDYRDGASAAPRSSVVDLVTGGAVAALGALTAALFGATLVRRLRVWAPAPGYGGEPYARSAPPDAGQDAEHGVAGYGPEHPAGAAAADTEPAPEQSPLTPAAAAAVDPGGALRDLLTPLVAALAADLRAREGGGEPEGKQL